MGKRSAANNGAAGWGREEGGGKGAKNYAWHPTHGYQGLLLHALSPGLAERLFPVIASPAAEALLSLTVVLGLAASSLPFFFPSVPVACTHACALLFLPSLQRLAILDRRLFRLQLRQFETIFLLVNFLSGYLATVLMARPEAKAWTHYMYLTGVIVFFLDSLRSPTWVARQTAAIYCLAYALWGVVCTWRLARHFDYDNTFSSESSIRLAPFVVGRLMTFAVYLAKYTVRLVLNPNCYVILKRPVSVATGAAVFDSTAASPSVRTIQVAPQPQEKDTGAGCKAGHAVAVPTAWLSATSDSPPPSPRPDEDHPEAAVAPPLAAPAAWALERSPTDLLKTRAASAYLNEEGLARQGPLLVEVLLPAHAASALCRVLSSDRAGYICFALVGLAGTMNMLALVFHSLPVSLAYGGLLIYLPTLRFLLLVDLQVLRRLMRQFETAYLLFNLLLLVYGVSGDRIFTQPALATTASHMVVNAGLPLLLDSVRLEPLAKLQIPAFYAPLTIGLVLMTSLRIDLYMDYEKQVGIAGLRTLTISFVVGRAATLGPFFAKNLLNLWLRPEVYVVITEPLSRHEDSHFMVRTLRTLAGVTSASSGRTAGGQAQTGAIV